MNTRSISPYRRTRGNGLQAAGPSLGQFHDEIDRMFQRFFEEPWAGATPRRPEEAPIWAPAMDIEETDGEITLRAEIPGVSADDIEISVADDILTISGEKKEETEREEKNFHVTERRFGSFRRSVQLPASVDRENVEAEFDNGVLNVTLKKSTVEPRKTIPVKPKKR